MANYLIVSNSTATRTYTLKTTHTGTPYLKVNDGYLDLTTATSSGIHAKYLTGTTTYRAKISTTANTTTYNTITQTTGYTGKMNYTSATGSTYSSRQSEYGEYITQTTGYSGWSTQGYTYTHKSTSSTNGGKTTGQYKTSAPGKTSSSTTQKGSGVYANCIISRGSSTWKNDAANNRYTRGASICQSTWTSSSDKWLMTSSVPGVLKSTTALTKQVYQTGTRSSKYGGSDWSSSGANGSRVNWNNYLSISYISYTYNTTLTSSVNQTTWLLSTTALTKEVQQAVATTTEGEF